MCPPGSGSLTLVALAAVLAVDLLIIGRRPHEPSMREAAAGSRSTWAWRWSSASACGSPRAAGTRASSTPAGSPSTACRVDNLFVFVIIMARFAVPRQYQQKVLLIGIVLALVMRGAFIAAGAALIAQFAWVFYIFGAFLVYTAIKLVRQGENDEDDFKENALIRWAERALPISERRTTAASSPPSTRPAGGCSPRCSIVMIAIGTTDLIFALDSIPAIFGLTKEPYLVFTANVFALMGLRQLYFLLGGLLERLVYLSTTAWPWCSRFIGVKLVLEALHEQQRCRSSTAASRRLGAGDPDLAVAAGHHGHAGRGHGREPDQVGAGTGGRGTLQSAGQGVRPLYCWCLRRAAARPRAAGRAPPCGSVRRPGSTSTHSSSRQNSSACSRESLRGGISFSVSSAVD